MNEKWNVVVFHKAERGKGTPCTWKPGCPLFGETPDEQEELQSCR